MEILEKLWGHWVDRMNFIPRNTIMRNIIFKNNFIGHDILGVFGV